MKRLAITAAVLLMLMGSAGALYDPYKAAIGQDAWPSVTRDSVVHGAPRFADNAYLGFGDGSGSAWSAVPDVTLRWNSTTSKFEIAGATSFSSAVAFAEPLTLSKADGTAPLVVTSTTKVTNLNADLLDGKDSTYFATAYWHVQVIAAPDIGASDTVASTVAVNDTGANLTVGDLLAQPDVPRTLSFAPSSTLTGFAWVAGTDIENQAITDIIEWDASDATKYTLNAYKTITTIDMLKTDGTDRTMNIGLTDNLGMDIVPDSETAVMFTWFDGDLETTLPTVTVGATVPESMIDIDGTLDGTKDIRIYVYVAP